MTDRKNWLITKMVSTFTNKPYYGNPAWVVIGLNEQEDEQRLVKLASALNPVSDTVFVFPKEKDADVYLRFFSSSEEINFSGHGTVATYFALENEGILQFTEPITLVRQKTKSGAQHLELRIKDNRVERVTVSLPEPQFISIPLDVKVIARFLGLPPVDIVDHTYPMGVVGLSGFNDIIVPVKSCETILNLNPNFSLMDNYCNRHGITGVVVWCSDTLDKQSNAMMRHFAPSVGINEDPVSGAAGAALGCFLVHHRIVALTEMTRIVIEQGGNLGRPGTVYVHVHTHDNRILKVTFGGQGVVTFEGRILAPED